MEDINPPVSAPKPKTAVVVIAILASALIFGGLGYFVGSMYKTDSTGTTTYDQKISTTSIADRKYVSDSENAAGNFSLTVPDGYIAAKDSMCEGVCLITLNLYKKESDVLYLSTDITVTSRQEKLTLEQWAASHANEPLPKDVTVAGVPAKKYTMRDMFSVVEYRFVKDDYAYSIKAPEDLIDFVDASIVKSFEFTK